MAIRPDWTTGTLTLVSGSVNFTTTGSALQTAAVQAGDAIITASGHLLIIESITGQNSGTLYSKCPAGAAGAGQALRIRYQPDGSRYQGAVRDLVSLLSGGQLQSLAGLDLAVGDYLRAAGAGVVGKVDGKNLDELANLVKANNQFLTLDNTGKLVLKAINSVLDANGKAADSGKLNGETKEQLPFFGFNQIWGYQTGNRVKGVSYQNTTAKTIVFTVSGIGGSAQVSRDNSTWINIAPLYGTGAANSGPVVVPVNWYYRLTDANTTVYAWSEFR